MFLKESSFFPSKTINRLTTQINRLIVFFKIIDYSYNRSVELMDYQTINRTITIPFSGLSFLLETSQGVVWGCLTPAFFTCRHFRKFHWGSSYGKKISGAGSASEERYFGP